MLLWKAQRYGKWMRPKPLYEPSAASIAFHNHGPRNEAINLSGTVNRPRRRAAGVTPSIASIFSVGSARRYISVVCMWARPSQSETLRRSPVAWNIIIAQLCRSRCGETCFSKSEGQDLAAVLTCLRSRYVKPTRVIGLPPALRNSSDAELWSRTASTNVGSGLLPKRQRSLLSPFAHHADRRCRLQAHSSKQRPVNSDTRSPAAKPR
jgi:hypothetical protein